MLPLQVVQILVQKFGRTRPTQVSFAEWILLCAHVAYMRSIFAWNDPAMTGRMTIGFEQLVHIATGTLATGLLKLLLTNFCFLLQMLCSSYWVLL